MTATNLRLVIGPPGTGKTTHLVNVANEAAEKHGPASVLVASLTRTAAAEFARRKSVIPAKNVGTLHGHCYRALGGNLKIAEVHAKAFNDSFPLYKLTQRTVDLDEPPDAMAEETSGDKCFALYTALRARMAPPETWPPPVRSFAEHWNEWKEQSGYADFQDLIDLARENAGPPPGIEIIYGDEIQDFSASEFDLVCRCWGPHLKAVVLVGDVLQTLYGWRGAAPSVIDELGIPAPRRRVLDQSYRVPRTVHAVACRWIAGHAGDKPAWRPRDADGNVERLNTSCQQPAALLPLIERKIASEQTVMILASCSYLLEPTLSVLRKAGIPFHNPFRQRRGDWNPLGKRRGTSSASRVMSFLEPADRPDRGQWGPQALKAWVMACRADGLLEHGAKAEIEKIDKETGYNEVDLFQLISWFRPGMAEAALAAAKARDLGWLAERLTMAHRHRIDYPMSVAKRFGVTALASEPKVIVSTIHGAKGGEADNVILYPDVSMAGSRAYRQAATRDSVLRTFYVGLTRARHSLYLCAGGNGHHVAFSSP